MASSASSVTFGEPRATNRERALDVVRTIVINLAFAALVAVVGYSLLVTYQLKQQETRQKELEVEAARADLQRDVEINEGLRHQIRTLRTEAGLEKVARERLGLVRPNESTYVVVNVPPALAATRAAAEARTPAVAPPSESLPVLAWRTVVELWNGGE